jgi:uncharacterized protein (TIGR01777 family)
MRVVVSGASGVIGGIVVPCLQAQGHTVRRLVRSAPRDPSEFRWNPATGELDPTALSGVGAIIHLAGENIAGGRWTAERKASILASRVQGTRTLAAAVAAREPGERPEVLVSASAVGLYGECGDRLLGEDAPQGGGFLAAVCAAWERELAALEPLGVRTVAVRTGIVLTPAGGALARMLPAFQAGVGGRMGSGRQWMSWISPDDLASIYLRAISEPAWRGAFNAVTPAPVTNAAFARTLARVLRRPALLPFPAWILRLIFGEMAEGALLVSTRALPVRLEAENFAWRHPQLEPALRHLLGKQTGRLP